MAAAADAREAVGTPTEASVMHPTDPPIRDRTRHIGKALLAAFVLLVAIVALILLL